ncbi:MAG: lysophospholipid acyltransferase family protein [Alphaproteobacteria bacterium]
MIALRSIVFNFLYIFGSLFLSLVLLWALVLPPRKCTAIISAIYGGYIALIEKYVLGLTLEVKGIENLPKTGGFIIASKHQSAYETLKIPFTKQFNYPVIVLKKELTKIPLWGLYPKRMGLIAIDRGQGMESMRAMTEGCRKAIADGRNVIIFPQGTRVTPGAVKPYKAGLAKIYKDLQVPIVPMALNSGVFWGRNAFIKKPGKVTFEFLPPIPAGEPPLQAMDKMEKMIEEASDRLVVAAGGPPLEKAG